MVRSDIVNMNYLIASCTKQRLFHQHLQILIRNYKQTQYSSMSDVLFNMCDILQMLNWINIQIFNLAPLPLTTKCN